MTGRHKEFTEEFRREAVRLSYSSGRTIREVAGDLGVGLSSLTRQERDLLKKATAFFAAETKR